MKKGILFVFSLVIFCVIYAQNIEVPKLEQRVTDLTGTLTQAEIQTLETKLRDFESGKGSQIALLILPTTGDEAIEQFSIRVVDAWQLGREGVDDGVLLMIALNDRKMRLEVGYGLEGALPDAIAKRIITNVITPEFRSGHFYQGINDGLDAVITVVNGEELPPALTSSSRSTKNKKFNIVLPFLLIGFVVFAIVNSVLTKKLGGTKSKLLTFVILLVIGTFIIGFLGSLFLSFIITLFSSMPTGRGGRGGYYGGYLGSGGRGFSSGGGFGGFSGGGGGFGGGGASGGW